MKIKARRSLQPSDCLSCTVLFRWWGCFCRYGARDHFSVGWLPAYMHRVVLGTNQLTTLRNFADIPTIVWWTELSSNLNVNRWFSQADYVDNGAPSLCWAVFSRVKEGETTCKHAWLDNCSSSNHHTLDALYITVYCIDYQPGLWLSQKLATVSKNFAFCAKIAQF